MAVAEGLRDPLVYPLYTLDGLVDPLQLLKPFPNETVTYLLPLTLSFVMAQPEPSVGPIDVTAKAPPLLDILNPRNYPPFDSRYILAYSNNQLRYYQALSALLGVDDDKLTRQINKRQTTLKATN